MWIMTNLIHLLLYYLENAFKLKRNGNDKSPLYAQNEIGKKH